VVSFIRPVQLSRGAQFAVVDCYLLRTFMDQDKFGGTRIPESNAAKGGHSVDTLA
jgi:hypothetical protein